MSNTETKISIHGTIILLLVISSVLILKIGYLQNADLYWGLLITLPLLLIAIVGKEQSSLQNKCEKLIEQKHGMNPHLSPKEKTS